MLRINEILKNNQHRPWTIPNEPWKFYQEWNDALFLHWEIDIKYLEPFIPKEIEIDLFDGKPWVSLVAFTMHNIRPKHLPAFSPVSTFHEINIRTYVRDKHKTGVYFLSIEGAKALSCSLARGFSQLPYRFSNMKRSSGSFSSQNSVLDDQFSAQFKIGTPLQEKTALDRWLTERYALQQDTKTTINSFEIHHIEWPIHKVSLSSLNLNYPRFKNLLTNKPNLIHYSPGVQVIAWGKHTKPKNYE